MKNKKFQYEIFREKWGLLVQRWRPKPAFLLLEIMIALTLFASMAIIIACNQACICDLYNQAAGQFKAVNRAMDILESGDVSSANDGRFIVEHSFKDFAIPAQIQERGLRAERLKKIKIKSVKVSWNCPTSGVRSINLESAQRIEQKRNE